MYIILQIDYMSNLLSFALFPAALITTDESLDTLRNTLEKEDGFHVNARQFHYPNSKLTRFPVPEEKVPWEVFHINFQYKFTSCWSYHYRKNDALGLLDGFHVFSFIFRSASAHTCRHITSLKKVETIWMGMFLKEDHT